MGFATSLGKAATSGALVSTREAVSAGRQTRLQAPCEVEHPINDSKGCGGVMRTAPLGFLPATVSDAEVFRLGAAVGALTHGHPEGYLPAGAMAVLTRDALENVTWDRSVAKVLELVRAWPRSDGTAAAIETAAKAATSVNATLGRRCSCAVRSAGATAHFAKSVVAGREVMLQRVVQETSTHRFWVLRTIETKRIRRIRRAVRGERARARKGRQQRA